MPVGSFALSMLEEPMAHETMHVIKKLRPRLSPTPLLQQSIFMLKNADGEASNKYAN